MKKLKKHINYLIAKALKIKAPCLKSNFSILDIYIDNPALSRHPEETDADFKKRYINKINKDE